MCYSAMVVQNAKKLGLKYQARIDPDAFQELFQLRLDGSGAKIPYALEASFLENPQSKQERDIARLIREWHSHEISETEKVLFAQKKRLADAERKLREKETKTALNEKRIASEKIEKAMGKLDAFKSPGKADEARIFPHVYAPLIVVEKGERLIRPFRYHLRPFGEQPEFDRKFDGAYNARRDRLKEVFWWKNLFGKKHGVMVITKFWENVKEHDFKHRKLKAGEKEKNLVLEFAPRDLDEMLVPTIFDRNEEGDFTLNSFALITDEPNPEVAAAGHDRTPIVMKDQYLDLWLQTNGKKLTDFELVFKDKQPTYFEHSVAA